MKKNSYINSASEAFINKLKKNLSIRNQNLFIKQQTVLLAFFVGLMSGLFAVAFRLSIEHIDKITNVITHDKSEWYQWLYLPLIVSIGGLIAGLAVKYVPDAAGSGIPEVRLTLAKIGRRIKIRNLIAVFVGGVASIGSGFALGREGPTVKIGATSGTFIANLFKLKGKKLKSLVAAGAGAGLAAAFNSPIAGVVFVVEELSQNFSTQFLAPCIVATVTSAAVTRYLTGNVAAYKIPLTLEKFSFEQLPVYLLLGLLAGVFGTIFIRLVLYFIDFFGKIKNISIPLKVALAGFITGIVGLFLPHVLGNGHDAIEILLYGNVAFWLIPLWLIFKLLLTAIGYGSGAPGGLFAPTLFCGASLGLFLGKIFNYFLPILGINPSNIALIGMGAFFTAVVRTPITGIVIIFEMTGGYEHILPLMLSCILADLVSSKLYPRAIYPALLYQATGIDLEAEKNLSPLKQIKVEDVMTKKVTLIDKSTSIKDAFEKIKQSHHNGFPVTSKNGEILGIITLFDIEMAMLNNIKLDSSISTIMTKNIIGISPNATLDTAINKLHDCDIGRLIVFDDNNKTKLIGILTKGDIIKAEIQTI